MEEIEKIRMVEIHEEAMEEIEEIRDIHVEARKEW